MIKPQYTFLLFFIGITCLAKSHAILNTQNPKVETHTEERSKQKHIGRFNQSNVVKLIILNVGLITFLALAKLGSNTTEKLDSNTREKLGSNTTEKLDSNTRDLKWVHLRDLGNSKNKHQNTISSICFSSNAQHIVTADEGGAMKVWDVETGKFIRDIVPSGNAYKKKINHVKYLPDNKHIITSASDDQEVITWNLKTGQKKSVLIANPNSNQGVNSIDVSKDGNLAAIADSTGIIGISKRGTNQITLIKHKKGVNHVSFSPQGKHFLTAHENGKINVWKVPITDDNGKKTSSQEPIITLGESFEWASWAEFSPDGNYIICTGNGQIEIWDWKKGKIVKFLEGSREVFNSVSLSPPHAHYILSTGDRDMLSIWKRQTGQVLQILSRNATTGCFSSDGKYIAASENGIVKVWHQKK